MRGANFQNASGFTAAQLYSTASYQAYDLTGVRLDGNLAGWNFAGQNLTNASFAYATLNDADFTGAVSARGELSIRLRLHRGPALFHRQLPGQGFDRRQLCK